MNSIIKNEFITNKKWSLILANILIIVSTLMAYFAITKISEGVVLNESEIMLMFFKYTLNIISPFIVILISKVLTEEFSNGGMKIYLINPISRNEVLISKLIFICINVLITIIIQIIISFIAASLLTQVPGLDLISDIIYKYSVTLIPIIGLISILFIPGLLINSSRHTISFGIFIIIGFDILCSYFSQLKPYSITYILKNIADINNHIVNNIIISLVYLLVGMVVSSYIFKNKEIR
ncbi:MAG: ABC transporter permease [Paraclostridium bifermentans]|uniref:ABC transporter permease n=1 Tax=Paraclostridium bifermentans TaxID=1490 RepID=UPI0011DCBF24|nr:ABC transporter permease [Paraclostridium bifermentans]MBS6508824.1 ABC transporter permease [Paraclostridium bifermentans]MDU3803296.1 ABC transporter permease [Paraclostridium bifermentans]